MIRHIVLVRLDPATTAEDRSTLLADLANMRIEIPGIRTCAVGESMDPAAYTLAGTFDFADEAALNAYLEHPHHLSLTKRLVSLAEGGRAGILVVNMDVQS